MHPLNTDDTGTVDEGGWQFEAAVDHTTDSADGVDSKETGVGVALIRGMGASWDAGIALGSSRVDDGETTQSGLGDGEVWLKWRFLEQGSTSLAVTPYLTLPTGDDNKGLGSGAVSWGATLVLSSDVTPEFSVHANLGWDHLNFGEDEAQSGVNRDLWRASAAVAYKASEAWTLVAEAGAAGAEDKGADDPAYGGLGVVYSLKACDLSAGYHVGLNDAEADHAFTVGVTLNW